MLWFSYGKGPARGMVKVASTTWTPFQLLQILYMQSYVLHMPRECKGASQRRFDREMHLRPKIKVLDFLNSFASITVYCRTLIPCLELKDEENLWIKGCSRNPFLLLLKKFGCSCKAVQMLACTVGINGDISPQFKTIWTSETCFYWKFEEVPWCCLRLSRQGSPCLSPCSPRTRWHFWPAPESQHHWSSLSLLHREWLWERILER